MIYTRNFVLNQTLLGDSLNKNLNSISQRGCVRENKCFAKYTSWHVPRNTGTHAVDRKVLRSLCDEYLSK